jgi:hypothetical protein
MFKWIFRLIITLVVLAGFAAIFFVYMISTSVASPDPEPPEVKSVLLRDFDLGLEKENVLKNEIADKKAIIQQQLTLLKDQEQIFENKQKEIAQNIEKELEIIRNKYQTRIDDYQELLAEEYVFFQQEKEQEYREKALVKKELLEDRLISLGERFAGDKVAEIEVYRTQTIQKYYSEILNLKLKLKVLKLTETEEAGYQERLEELEELQSTEIEREKQNIEKRMQEEIQGLEEEFQQEFKKYQAELDTQYRADLEYRMAQDQKRLNGYITEQQKMLDRELRLRQESLRERSQAELDRLQRIIAELEDDYFQLLSELTQLEKDVDVEE